MFGTYQSAKSWRTAGISVNRSISFLRALRSPQTRGIFRSNGSLGGEHWLACAYITLEAQLNGLDLVGRICAIIKRSLIYFNSLISVKSSTVARYLQLFVDLCRQFLQLQAWLAEFKRPEAVPDCSPQPVSRRSRGDNWSSVWPSPPSTMPDRSRRPSYSFWHVNSAYQAWSWKKLPAKICTYFHVVCDYWTFYLNKWMENDHRTFSYRINTSS